MEKEVLNTMFENLLHIGNKTNYWNPRMKIYIYGSVNGIHVINLVKTEEKIEEVKKQLQELHTSGKKILFVGTKLQARDAVKKLASETGHYYVAEKWVPGLLTNFKTIKRRIGTYIQLDKDLKNGVFDVLTKKEKASKMLELEKLDKAYSGVKDMKKIPDVIFVVDGIYEDQALKEAKSLNLISFAIFNTNGDDSLVTNCIPANTNSVKSIEYILDRLKGSISGKVVAPTVNKTQVQTDTVKFRKIEDKKISGEKRTTQVKTKTAPKVESEKNLKEEELVKSELTKDTEKKSTAKTQPIINDESINETVKKQASTKAKDELKKEEKIEKTSVENKKEA